MTQTLADFIMQVVVSSHPSQTHNLPQPGMALDKSRIEQGLSCLVSR